MTSPSGTLSPLARVVQATRARTLPLVLAPLAAGSALAWTRAGVFEWGRFALACAGAAGVFACSMAINDFFDDATGVDRAAREDHVSVATGSTLLASGEMTAAGTLRLAAAAATLALGCGIALGLTAGWTAFLLGAAALALGVLYVAPPVAYGYVGRGLGEAGIFLAFGILPVAGGYLVQAGTLDGGAVGAGVAPGLLAVLVFSHHNLLHWRSDAQTGKRTPAAVLGPERALALSAPLMGLACGALVAQVALGVVPAAALAGLAAIVPLFVVWVRASRELVVQVVLQLLGVSLGAAVLVSLATTAALVVSGPAGS